MCWGLEPTTSLSRSALHFNDEGAGKHLLLKKVTCRIRASILCVLIPSITWDPRHTEDQEVKSG